MSTYSFVNELPTSFTIVDEPLDAEKLIAIHRDWVSQHDSSKDTKCDRERYSFLTNRINYLNPLAKSINTTYVLKSCNRYYGEDINHSILPREIRYDVIPNKSIDVDIKNCNPTILLNLFRNNGIECDKLEYYVLRREKVLKMIKESLLTDDPKGLITAVINGANIGGNTETEGFKWLKDFKKQLSKAYREYIEKYPNSLEPYRKLLRDNPKYEGFDDGDYKWDSRLVDYVVKEKESLATYNALMYSRSNSINAYGYTFDGFLISDSLHEDDVEVYLTNLNQFINEGLGFYHHPIEFINKPFDRHYENFIFRPISEYTENDIQFNDEGFISQSYDIIKRIIENRYFCYNQYVYDTKYNVPYNELNFKTKLKHLRFLIDDGEKIKITNFVDKWLLDPTKRKYDIIDFLPPPLVCPASTYNTWTDFWFNSHKPTKTAEQCWNFVERFIENVRINVGGFSPEETEERAYYLLQFLKDILIRPAHKSGVCPVLKGMQGSGKSVLWQLVGHVIGDDKYYECPSPDKLLDKFNSVGSNKLLVILNEFPADAGRKYRDVMKAKITDTNDTVELKGKDAMKVRSCTRYAICSNNPNPIDVEESDRRYFVCEVKEKQPNDWYKILHQVNDYPDRHLDELYWLAQYIIDIEISESFSFQRDMPKTREKVILKELNRHPIHDFTNSLIETIQKRNNNSFFTSTELYKLFRKYMLESGFKEDRLPTIKGFVFQFKQDLKLAHIYETKRTRTANGYFIDMDKLNEYRRVNYPEDVIPEEDIEDDRIEQEQSAESELD